MPRRVRLPKGGAATDTGTGPGLAPEPSRDVRNAEVDRGSTHSIAPAPFYAVRKSGLGVRAAILSGLLLMGAVSAAIAQTPAGDSGGARLYLTILSQLLRNHPYYVGGALVAGLLFASLVLRFVTLRVRSAARW